MKIPNLDAIKDWLLSKIINNMMVTEPGFFMDARQGPVIQGEIDEVNNRLSEVTSKLFDYQQLFKTVDVESGIRNYSGISAIIIEFTPPDGYIPLFVKKWTVGNAPVVFGVVLESSSLIIYINISSTASINALATIVFVKENALLIN